MPRNFQKPEKSQYALNLSQQNPFSAVFTVLANGDVLLYLAFTPHSQSVSKFHQLYPQNAPPIPPLLPPIQCCCSGPCHHLSSSWWFLQSPDWCSCTTEQPEWASSLFGSQFMTFFLPKPFNKSSSHLNWVTVTSMVSDIHSVTSIVSLFLAHLCTPALVIHILSFNVLISLFST